MKRAVGIRKQWVVGSCALAALVLASGDVVAQEQANGGSGGRARVLVAPLRTTDGINRNFGRKVAEDVRKDLREFPSLTSIDSKELSGELKRLKLDEKDLGLIQWRQLAGRMDAQVVIFGTVEPASGGNVVNVSFVDAKTGDELTVPEFTVPGDRGDDVKRAAGLITQAFETHIEYNQALLFCQDYLSASQYDDALRNCDRALEINPNSSTALYTRGRVYMGQEDWPSARQDLAAVVDKNPAETLALQSLAYTNAQLGNMERATELYREYLNFNPDDASVRLNVAFNLANAGGHDEAIQLLQEGLARDSTNADLWEFLGNVALSKGTAAEGSGSSEAGVTDEASVRLAVDAYNRVLTLRGDDIDPKILRQVIAANLALGDLQAALDFARRAQTMMPDDPALWSITSDVYNKMGRLRDAIGALDRVLELDASYPNAHLRRGLYRLRTGEGQAAVGDLRAAVDAGTDANVVAGQLLAVGHASYFAKGDYARAISMFRTGMDFATKPEIRDQLYFFTAYGYFQQGVALDKRNEAAEACEPARRALAKFQQVMPNLRKAGRTQPRSQQQIAESTDVYLFRQEQIIKKACK
ncbi:MAG: tetratricopeptide repeat protein [Gemmatimonadota bacterium]